MVYTFEIIGIIFVLIMIYFTYLSYKRKELSKVSFLFWLCFWIAGGFLVIFHSFVNKILPPLQIIRVMDLYMILSFIFLFSLIFYLFRIVNKSEKRLEELARIIALKGLDKEKK